MHRETVQPNQKNKMSEAIIRDLLASDLTILEPGLKLLAIEKYIPSNLGTRSFIDLLAKDPDGQWVIIEVKKTNAAAREAAHEIFKYAEEVKTYFGARNDEIRVIVASAEWKELLLPFSRLTAESDINVRGFQLNLNTTADGLTASRVQPIELKQGRYLAPWHETNLYHDFESLQRGISTYDSCCKAKGMQDYILVVMKAADDFNDKARNSFHTIIQMLNAENGIDISETSTFEPESYDYILYFCPQILTEDFCTSLLASDPKLLEQVTNFVEKMSAEEKLCVLHTNVYDMDPHPHRDYFEIGYPAKFSNKLLNDEKWHIQEVLRRGVFARNTLLDDEVILDEIKGLAGSSKQAYRRQIDLTNRAHIAMLRADLATVFESNPSWLAQSNRVLDDVLKDSSTPTIDINIYHPSAGIFTLYFLATEEDTMSVNPLYTIKAGERIYVGHLTPSGNPLTLKEILEKYYDGEIFNLMLLASTGFREKRDADILDDLGLVYRTFRCDSTPDGYKWAELRDERWREFEPTMPFQPLQSYFSSNGKLIDAIRQTIGSRMHDGYHDLN